MSESLLIAIIGAITTIVVAVIPVVVPVFMTAETRNRFPWQTPYPWLPVLAIGFAVVAIVVAVWPKQGQGLHITSHGTYKGVNVYQDHFDTNGKGILLIAAGCDYSEKATRPMGWIQVNIMCDGVLVGTSQDTIKPFVDNTVMAHASAVHTIEPGFHKIEVTVGGDGHNAGEHLNVEYSVLSETK